MPAKRLPEDMPQLVVEAQPWLDELVRRNYRPGTVTFSRCALLKLALYLNAQTLVRTCREIRAEHLQAWQRSMFEAKLAMATVQNALDPVRRYFAWLEDRGRIFENPARGLIMPRYTRPMQPVPSEGDLLKLLRSIRTDTWTGIRDRALIETAYASGLRSSELAGLDVNSVDLVNRTVRTLGKGQRERVVPLTQAAVMAIRHYLDDARKRLLLDNQGEPALWIDRIWHTRLGTCGVKKAVVDRAHAVGLHLTPQAIRRAFATHLLHHGAAATELKFLLGHSTFRHLRHYLRYSPEELRRVHRKSRPRQ